jgi:hypothetical protein
MIIPSRIIIPHLSIGGGVTMRLDIITDIMARVDIVAGTGLVATGTGMDMVDTAVEVTGAAMAE